MICLVGGTGTGKDTIKRELLKRGYEPVITYTTRPKRPGEVDGVSYHFITKSEFRRLKAQEFFAETTYYDVASGERWYYGSSFESLKLDSQQKVVILNPYGIRNIFKKLSTFELVDWFVVNLYCNDPEIIKKRLEKRGDKEEEISRRIKADKIDFEGIDYYSNMDMCNDGSNKPEVLAKVIDETYERFLIDG